MIEPGVYPLTIYAGVPLDETIIHKTVDEDGTEHLVDNTGCAALLQVRERTDSDVVLLELSSDDGSIVLGGADATIRLLQTAAATKALTFKRGVYDLLIGPDLTVDPDRLLEGPVRVSPGVTR